MPKTFGVTCFTSRADPQTRAKDDPGGNGASNSTDRARRDSAVGRYLKWSMTRAMEALRFAGILPLSLGAWFHQPLLIALGLAMVLFGWLRGLVFPRKQRG